MRKSCIVEFYYKRYGVIVDTMKNKPNNNQDTLRYVRFNFLGWSKKDVEKACKGSLNYWQEESAAGRGPTPFIVAPFVDLTIENDEAEDGTVLKLEARLKVMYNAEYTNPAAIQNYLQKAGLRLSDPSPANGILVTEEETPAFKKATFKKWIAVMKRDPAWKDIGEDLEDTFKDV